MEWVFAGLLSSTDKGLKKRVDNSILPSEVYQASALSKSSSASWNIL